MLYNSCRYPYVQLVSQDVNAFIWKNPSIQVELVGLTEQ